MQNFEKLIELVGFPATISILMLYIHYKSLNDIKTELTKLYIIVEKLLSKIDKED